MSTSDHSSTNETQLFRITIFFVCIVQVLASIYEIWRGTAFTITVGVLVLIATLGLYRRLRWGHRMSTVFLWLLMVVGVGLMLPVRIEGDAMMGAESPSVLLAAAQAVAICGAAIISLHFLGKHKSLFRSDWF